MAAYVNANNAYSTLAGNITAADTSFTLTVGNSFPVVTDGNWSFATLQDIASNIEIVKITQHGDGANSFTCVRGQEGTAPRAWIAGDFVECRFTAGTTVTVDGIQTLTNKTFASPAIRFADGTLVSPGITWANEPTTGFTRTSATVMAVSINTVNTMHWQPGHTFVNSQLNMPNSGAITFYNAGNGALWEVLHGNSANTLHVGRIGWGSTTIYGGGVGNVYVHGGGVNFGGNVVGVTKAMVGLGNVHNRQQIQELRPGVNLMYMGWNGSQIDVQVDNNYMGGLWPISISGNAATASSAPNASNANNANAVNGISGWSYSNVKNDPVYVWATDGSTGHQFLAHRASMHVNYADTAGYAGSAGNANSLGGMGPNSFLKSQDGSCVNIRMWDDYNGDVYVGFTANRNLGPGWSDFTLHIWGYGGTGSGNSSIHPDSRIAMADGSEKWLRDVRVGDSVWGLMGPAEVLGIWTNILQERSLWEVATADGAIVCTPGHLIPVMVNGEQGWGAPVPEMYWSNSHGRKRTVKGKRGLIDTLCTIVGDDEHVHTITAGVSIRRVSGEWVPVTGLREVGLIARYDKETKRSTTTRINENQQVIALHLEGSHVFYADGYAVATLA